MPYRDRGVVSQTHSALPWNQAFDGTSALPVEHRGSDHLGAIVGALVTPSIDRLGTVQSAAICICRPRSPLHRSFVSVNVRGGPMRFTSSCWKFVTQVLPPSVERSALHEK